MESIFIDRVLPFGDWELRQQKQSFLSAPTRRWQHNPMDEKTLDHPILGIDLYNMNEQLKAHLAKLKALIEKEEYSGIEEISALAENIAQLMNGPAKHEWSFAIIGESGEGKSTLTNSLLGRRDLAAKSGGTKSCTQYATRYQHLPGAPDDTTVSDVTLRFYNHNARREITQEHLKNINFVLHPIKDPAESESGDEEKSEDEENMIITEYDKRRSDEGIEFLKISIQGNQDAMHALKLLITNPHNFSSNSLLNWSLKNQDEFLKRIVVDATDAIRFYDIPDKRASLNSRGEQSLPDILKLAHSWASLVDVVVISTGGALLRHGIVLLDVPGYGDRSQARVASTNAHRRGVHGELVVASAKRVEDRESVDKHLLWSIKAHGAKNTVLVVNQIDQLEDLDTEELGEMLKESHLRPFPQIRLAFSKVAARNKYRSYENYLTDSAQSAAKRQLMEVPLATLKERYGEQITVVATCASDYHRWQDPYRSSDPKFGPYMSGIPHLRQTLFKITAEQKLRIYKTHYFQALPNVLGRIQRIRTKIVDKTGVAASCRASLKKSFQESIRASRAAQRIGYIVDGIRLFTVAQKTSTTQRIRFAVKAWSDPSLVPFQTFNHTVLHKGIPRNLTAKAYIGRDVNWNRDLLETMERPINKNDGYRSLTSLDEPIWDWMNKLLKMEPEITGPIVHSISELSNSVSITINYWFTPSALKNSIESGWKKVDKNLQVMIGDFSDEIKEVIDQVYGEITDEVDVGCTIAFMNRKAYRRAETQGRGKGVYNRQRQSLLKSFCSVDSAGKRFVDRYEELAVQKMKETLVSTSNDFINRVEAELNEFVRTTEQLVKTNAYNTYEHAAARQELEKWLPEFEKQLRDCQRQFEAQQEHHDDQLLGSFERLETSDSEPRAKKIKVGNDKGLNTNAATKAPERKKVNQREKMVRPPRRSQKTGSIWQSPAYIAAMKLAQRRP